MIICGIFFAFGYTMGRRNAHATAASRGAPCRSRCHAPPLPENELSGAPLKPQAPDDGSTTSPSDERANRRPRPNMPPSDAAKHARERTDSAASHPRATRVVESATPNPSLSAVPYSHRAPLPTKPHAGTMAPLAQAPGDCPIVPGQPIMVQIAAVSRQEDAEVLAGALRKRGFNPTVHPGTADKFFHVQVGPFTDKTQADTMKQHLLADGYNAIVK